MNANFIAQYDVTMEMARLNFIGCQMFENMIGSVVLEVR